MRRGLRGEGELGGKGEPGKGSYCEEQSDAVENEEHKAS